MKSDCRIPALALMLAIGAAVPAFGQAAPPFTLNVKVQVSKLSPQIYAVNVRCYVSNDAMGIMLSDLSGALVTNGGYDGVIQTPLKFLPGRSIEDLNKTPNVKYECDLLLVNGATGYPESPLMPTPNEPWLYPQPGTPFTPTISGPFPPKPAAVAR
jgi:hypothetical protein